MSDRTEVTFQSGDASCSAWVYGSDGDAGAPVVVMAHGLGGIREARLDAYAERFQAAGFACLVFDYRHFGASGGSPRQLLDIGRQLEDWSAAIDHARSDPQTAGRAVVLWGTSFSGGHVIVTAARKDGIAGVIAQCPFTDGLASAMAMSRLAALKVTFRGLRDAVGAKLGRPPLMVATAGRPGSMALMTAPDAYDGYLGLVPADTPFRNEVCARIALHIPWYSPGRSAAKVECPILFAVCEKDSVAPARATLRHAHRAPQGEIRSYDEGHFDIYRGEPFERVVSDQIAFLKQRVRAVRRQSHR